MFRFVLSWYLVRNFLKWTGIVGLGIAGIVMLFDFFELVRKASPKSEISFSILLQMLFLKIPHLLQQVLPFMVLFSSILTLWMLNRYQEMTIMKASGLSIWQILAPLASTVWILGAVDLFLLNPITAQMMSRYEHMDHRYFQTNSGSLAVSESGLWIRERKENVQRIFHISHINQKTHELRKISLFEFNLNDQFLKQIEATSGSLRGNLFILNKVWKQSSGSIPQYVRVLQLPTTLSFSTLENTGISPGSVSFLSLPHFSEILENSGLSGHKYMMYWHSLLARWAWLGVMVVLAASCSLRLIRQQGTLVVIAAGIMSAFLLYFLRDITYALGNAGTLPIILAAWTPVGISALSGMTVLLYFEEG